MADDSRKIPPHSIEAEESVLGGILIENSVFDSVVELLRPEDFYREAHRKILRAALELNQRNDPIDLVTLAEVLRARGELQDVGGASYLAELAERVPTAANVAYYAKIVRDKALLRSLIQVSTEITMTGYEAQGDVETLLDDAERRVYEIAERKIRQSLLPVREIVVESMKQIELLYDRQSAITGVPSGYRDLDKKTAGLQPSDLIIVAGRPGMGKTAFALNIVQHAALHANVGVAVFSLEMSKEQLVLRLLCSEARVDQGRVRSGYAAEQDYPKLALAAQHLSEVPIYIDDTGGLSILEMRAKARRLSRDKSARLGLIVVDYLQLMKGPQTDNREQEISAISRSLKALAKELKLPIVALAQLNRKVEDRSDKRPIMADLRESGAIEQDADVILFLNRPIVYDKTAEPRDAEVIIGKQRNGPIGTIPLTFFAEYTRFDNRAEDEVSFGEDAEEA